MILTALLILQHVVLVLLTICSVGCIAAAKGMLTRKQERKIENTAEKVLKKLRLL